LLVPHDPFHCPVAGVRPAAAAARSAAAAITGTARRSRTLIDPFSDGTGRAAIRDSYGRLCGFRAGGSKIAA
jgi:hypothetical protein